MSTVLNFKIKLILESYKFNSVFYCDPALELALFNFYSAASYTLLKDLIWLLG